jgi:hypothetical protein
MKITETRYTNKGSGWLAITALVSDDDGQTTVVFQSTSWFKVDEANRTLRSLGWPVPPMMDV